jgi:hypothetical protein
MLCFYDTKLHLYFFKKWHYCSYKQNNKLWFQTSWSLILNNFSLMIFSIQRNSIHVRYEYSYVKICKHTHPMNDNVTTVASSELSHILYFKKTQFVVIFYFTLPDNTETAQNEQVVVINTYKRTQRTIYKYKHTPFNESQKLHSILLYPNF